MTEFREKMIDSVARIEQKVETVLERQEEDRVDFRAALKQHTDQDAANFTALQKKQDRVDKVINYGIGGLVVLQVILGLIF